MIRDILKKNSNVNSISKDIEILHKYFPGCFNNEGKFDIDKFKSQITDRINICKEGYDLNFLGKSYARLLASTDTTTVIKPDLEHNNQPGNSESENLYISGDNLDGLKHLLKSYSNQVKCIYIDPPYNTGTDGFVYNDKFQFTPEDLQTKLSITEEEAYKILDLTKRGSASHSAWLMFMMPRLQLAKDLLKKDGIIFISIDDNEQANLKLLCDNIFGEENFISVFCRKGTGGRQDSSYFAVVHEYILCYVRDSSQFNAGRQVKVGDSYPKYDKALQKYYKTQLLRKWGANSLRTDRPNLYFPIKDPDGNDHYPIIYEESVKNNQTEVKKNEGCWRWGRETMEGALKEGKIEFQKDKYGKWIAYEKIYKPEIPATKLYNTWIDTVNSKSGKPLLKELFEGESPFEYPKPLDLIKLIIQMANLNKNEIVLDFFSGSATTAHAVMSLNAEDNLKRKYIMIQWQEKCSEKSVAYRMGYKTIDQIGQDRIKRAAKKIKTETGADIDYGFKHYTLEEPQDQTLKKLFDFDPKVLFNDNTIMDRFGRETVIETWLVNDGYGFGAQYKAMKLSQYTAYYFSKHLYLIDSGFNEEDMVTLVDKYLGDNQFNPENIVIFGYSFTFSQTEMLRKNLVTLRDSNKNLNVNINIRY